MQTIQINLNKNEIEKLERSLKIVSKMAEFTFVGSGHFVEAKTPKEADDAIRNVKAFMSRLHID